MNIRLGIFLAAAVLAAPCGASAADLSGAARGALLVQANCSRCHATVAGGISPLPAAPTFVDVAGRYPPEELEEALAEGIITGHAAMPEFVFQPDEIDAIVAYLGTLRKP